MGRSGWFALLFVVALASLPHLRGHLAPPKGYSFNTAFLSREDFYNYLGYVQQAEDGRFLLANKLDEVDRPLMVNLEWWVAGRISAALGRRPLAAFWLLGLAATAALVAAVDVWLHRAGIAEPMRLRALLLILLGGGLGGVRFLLFGPPAWRSLDLIAGLYPFIEIISNPHFVAATALLCLALLAFMRPAWRWQLGGIVLGTVLALSRPYDLVLLVGIRTVGVMLSDPPRLWARRLVPLAGLLPAVGYLYWLFYASGVFSTFFAGYVTFPLVDLLVSFGPAVLLLSVFRPRPRGAPGQAAEAHLLAWVLVGVFLLLARPVGFYFQALVGIGLPLLALASIGLSRFRPAVLLGAAALMCTTSLAALHLFLDDRGNWYTLSERRDAAVALRGACRQGDLALAPPDIGLLALAYSPCRPWISDRLRPPEREEEMVRFYEMLSPAERSDWLDRRAIEAVVLPGGGADPATQWLGAGTSFRLVALVGHPPRRLAIVSRSVSAARR